ARELCWKGTAISRRPGDHDRRTGGCGGLGAELHRQRLPVLESAEKTLVIAEIDAAIDRRAQAVAAAPTVLRQPNGLRPQRDRGLLPLVLEANSVGGHMKPATKRDAALAPRDLLDDAAERVVLADEAGDKWVCRLVVERVGRADLHERAVVEDG